MDGSNFDEAWDGWSSACLMLLRQAADIYANAGPRALTPDTVVARLLLVLIRYRSSYAWDPLRVRFFDETKPPPPPAEDSFARLATTPLKHQHAAEVIGALTSIVSSAAQEWTLGDPEQPDTREILRKMFDVLWTWRLIPQPPSHVYPRGV